MPGYITKIIAFTTVGSGSFIVPNDWTNSGSLIEIIAGGGGGRRPTNNATAAGGGGAGGGYSSLSNFNLIPGPAIAFLYFPPGGRKNLITLPRGCI